MSKENPFVTIITPNFNGEKYLEETIKSVLNQTNQDFEYILFDACSDDGSIDILKKYETKIDNLIIEKDKGVYDAIDKGIQIAKGEVILWINSDDTLHEDAVSNIIKIFQTEDVDWISGINGYIKGNIKFSGISYFYPNLIVRNGLAHHNFWGFIQQESTVFRKSLYISAGGFKKPIGNAGDYHLWKNFSQKKNLHSFHIKIGYFRTWAGQNSQIQINEYYKDTGFEKNFFSFRIFRLIFSLMLFPYIYIKTYFVLNKYKKEE